VCEKVRVGAGQAEEAARGGGRKEKRGRKKDEAEGAKAARKRRKSSEPRGNGKNTSVFANPAALAGKEGGRLGRMREKERERKRLGRISRV
jgi:hypothetical protein